MISEIKDCSDSSLISDAIIDHLPIPCYTTTIQEVGNVWEDLHRFTVV